MADHILNAETGRYEVTGGQSRATLGAPYTGRSIDVESALAAASAWLKICSEVAPKHSDPEARFCAELAEGFPGTINGPLFRGRFLDAPPRSSFEFGPPEANIPRGRYNWAGRAALYLCNSEHGVMSELGVPSAGRGLWIQQFRPGDDLKLFDGRNLLDTSFAAAVFWLIEQQRTGTEPPPLGARIAELIGETFDGMIVPGVRGDSQLYSNVVIFLPGDRWRALIDDSRPPWQAA